MSESVSFEVMTDLAPVAATQIESNFETVRAWLSKELAPYASLVVTEDAISSAKNIRANIRRVSDGIDEQRKAVKKAWMQPYTEFEAKCKELTALCADTASNIDQQVKAFERQKKDEKIAALRVYFQAQSAGVAQFLKFEDIFNPKWENFGFKEEDAQEEIDGKIQEAAQDLDTIRSLSSPFEPALLDEYSITHSLRAVLAKENILRARQKAEEERKEAEAVSMFQDGENAPESATEAQEAGYSGIIRAPFAEPMPRQYTLRFEVTATKAQLQDLKDFFHESGIVYKKI